MTKREGNLHGPVLRYRPEINGLRAFAVIAVILAHAGFNVVPGGLLGVDIFFVISGYLISSLISHELSNETFSLMTFYERRIRRILPALLFVTSFSAIVGFFLLMPDDYKNLGQSIFATVFFSNNYLLAITSGYWDTSSKFKPLLHTWSLGVEEQFYLLIPLALLALWKLKNFTLAKFYLVLFVFGLSAQIYLNEVSQNWSFYSLPSRSWELALGGLVSTVCDRKIANKFKKKHLNTLGDVSLLILILSVLVFHASERLNIFLVLLTTVSTAMVLIFSKEGSLSWSILTNQLLIKIGLMSYSLYLWHQPVFAFLRAWSRTEPSNIDYGLAIIPIFLASMITWKFVENPFRDSNRISKSVLYLVTTSLAIALAILGLYLNSTYGLSSRVFDKNVNYLDIDKRSYNERVFEYKKDSFDSKNKTKVLIVGNSFARDFTNIVLETLETQQLEIVYRDDLNDCMSRNSNASQQGIYSQAQVIVFASGSYTEECISNNFSYAKIRSIDLFYVGSKYFGDNVNWLMRLDGKKRGNQFNSIPIEFVVEDKRMLDLLPLNNYVSIMSPILNGRNVPITDQKGRLLSSDRTHLTKFGATFLGEKILKDTYLALILKGT